MPGPKPKDPAVRARRNKASTHDVLDPNARVKAPSLTKDILGVEMIRPQVHRWWRVVWRSPMAPRWLEADVEVLYLIATLRNKFVGDPTPTLASEIRQQEARLGLDVMSRRRADWRIENSRTEPADVADVTIADVPDEAEDPRRLLRAVK